MTLKQVGAEWAASLEPQSTPKYFAHSLSRLDGSTVACIHGSNAAKRLHSTRQPTMSASSHGALSIVALFIISFIQ